MLRIETTFSFKNKEEFLTSAASMFFYVFLIFSSNKNGNFFKTFQHWRSKLHIKPNEEKNPNKTKKLAKLKRKYRNPAKEKIVTDCMEGHQDIARGYVQGDRVVAEANWSELAQKLNSPGPPTKDKSGWKKTWADWKLGGDVVPQPSLSKGRSKKQNLIFELVVGHLEYPD